MKCEKCSSHSCIKSGMQKTGRQKWFCKCCKKYFQEEYDYKSCGINNLEIIILTKEGCGIRSTSRILGISPKTVLRRILKISKSISRPYSILKGKIYQVDELFTYINRKENRVCVAYSFEPKTKKVIGFLVGRRNKTNLRKVTSTLTLSD